MCSNVLYEERGKVAVISLSRPDKMNAISEDLLKELNQIIEKINNEEKIIVAVITGNGKAFMAGADLEQVFKSSPEQNRKYNRLIIETFNKIENSPVPFIAAINGYALGGGLELALACTIRIASENAVIGLPEVKLGIMPGAGGVQRLVRTTSRGQAMKLLLTGKNINANEANKLLIIDEVVPLEKLMEHSINLAEQISENAPLAVKAIKEAVTIGADLPLNHAIHYTEESLEKLTRSIDCKEGIEAFLEQRKPDFIGE
ncbi:enoyl-CoA hydratase/isomerase family protein [Viridibacillus sp. NPDC093762]|uniref:enoyl-CoA hydratase/isomerase family protein n=1 Tax=Viridibacillus sp. NPDC093762 TaxID=3390720 RepID=UPI003D07B6CF